MESLGNLTKRYELNSLRTVLCSQQPPFQAVARSINGAVFRHNTYISSLTLISQHWQNSQLGFSKILPKIIKHGLSIIIQDNQLVEFN